MTSYYYEKLLKDVARFAHITTGVAQDMEKREERNDKDYIFFTGKVSAYHELKRITWEEYTRAPEDIRDILFKITGINTNY